MRDFKDMVVNHMDLIGSMDPDPLEALALFKELIMKTEDATAVRIFIEKLTEEDWEWIDWQLKKLKLRLEELDETLGL